MKLVVDLNIIFSALIKDSMTRHLLRTVSHDLYFPEPYYVKVLSYFDFLEKKSGLSREVLSLVLTNLFKRIQVVSRFELEPYWDQAYASLREIDEEDCVLLACALSLKEDVSIWSNDPHLTKQYLVPVITTTWLLDNSD